ncbi:restriction endonuclease subunit S [Aeromonas hydrophila]|uniref:Type I restriction modification DNA specificity domain-containing protein n=1 Tax=Aeromonas veronii TaxID=654 RepID=A0AAN1QH56_AERVE|nr:MULTISPECIES: restriction endonuclease subunit S [Aeromonas]MDD9308016.1 restriction endonuclease subunit S [Aeromonas hydrophila]AYV39031.1 hypothetical protein EFI48_20630 [Aeromonas veronii]MBE8735942.1 hypothetical protein [Aeromonas veronii]MBE8738834.1 hypothetical protein [Aeromonas veronii]MBE8744785.1 hypothetical protein [Aeromonas veronii]
MMLRACDFDKSWPIVSLDKAVDFLDNLRKPIKASERTEGDFIYYGANGPQGTIDDYIFDEPLILLAEDGGHFGNPNRDIAYIANGKYWVNNHAHVLKPKDGVDINFLYRVLQRYDVTPYIKGATRAKLTKGDASKILIPVPSPEVQKRIAAILDKADAIRQKRQQAIALADDFLRSVFLDMFGDPVTNPKGCKLLPMTEVFHIKTGKLNSNAEVKSGVYPFFTCAKEVYRIDHYAFDQEALLLAGNNAQADYDVKHYIGKFNAYQRTYVLSLKNENWSYPFFKFALEFQLSNLKNSSKGSNTKYITMEIMSRTMLPSPSPSEQSEFATYFKQQMDMRNILDKSQQESNALFNSLSQKAFSGQL